MKQSHTPGLRRPIEKTLPTPIPRKDNAILFSGLAVAFIALLTLASFGETMADRLACLTHDFGKEQTLFSYAPSPKEQLGQAEAVTNPTHDLPAAHIKSPKTMFMSLWRPDTRAELKVTKPKTIFLTCNFATQPFETPASIIEQTDVHGILYHASLQARWRLTPDGYELTRIELEIQSDQKSFRSVHSGDQLGQIKVRQSKMIFPDDATKPFHFQLQAELPARYNSGRNLSEPIVRAIVEGQAAPFPKWIDH
jgi:hypothetical protein